MVSWNCIDCSSRKRWLIGVEMSSATCNGLDDTVPAGITMQCEAKYTGMDAHKAIVCEHEPAAWCSLRGIWVCQKCCQMCYKDMYPEGCMEAEQIFRER